MLTLLLGGARSGKSALALRLAASSPPPVTFIATADAGDEEMAARILAHRHERPTSWSTVEEPVHLARAVGSVAEERTVVIDCLTLWVANMIEAGYDDAGVLSAADTLAPMAWGRPGRVIAVSNEVGSGIVPMSPLSRRYRDLLGRVNVSFAHHAGEAFLVVAGRVLPLLAVMPSGDPGPVPATQ